MRVFVRITDTKRTMVYSNSVSDKEDFMGKSKYLEICKDEAEVMASAETFSSQYHCSETMRMLTSNQQSRAMVPPK